MRSSKRLSVADPHQVQLGLIGFLALMEADGM